jgi:hypothetical protein
MSSSSMARLNMKCKCKWAVGSMRYLILTLSSSLSDADWSFLAFIPHL